ncbi:MAG: aldo/keto reductase [Acidobacteria bacterium]|nr:MAG: aldo/keto reductase [Acidobacteriota bacterium]
MNTPHGIPRLGLGTWGRTGNRGRDALLTAIELGYRHFDTAQTYGTETVVRDAIAASRLPRADFFITTKVGDVNLDRTRFLPSVHESLDRLGVDRIDLLLIHWPSPNDEVPFEEYMGALAEAKALGLASLIGVSNFPSALVERACDRLGAGEIVTNQVEMHPFLQNRALRRCCERNNVALTAFMPLARGRAAGDPSLQRIAARHGVAPAAVALAWVLYCGVIAIPSSEQHGHLQDNLRALTLGLSPDDLAEIHTLDCGYRIVNPAKAPVWD